MTNINEYKLYNSIESWTPSPKKAFDDLAELAGVICDAPISLVSFVDAERQWFKSRIGVDVTETPRDQAFCAHAIKQNQIMVVEDATLDERFADNPLVTGEPGIRFYAGAPLVVSGGIRLGTLCVIDRNPRTLTKAQSRALTVLRDAVVTQLELRKAAQDLEAMESLLPMCSWCKKVRVEEEGRRTLGANPGLYVRIGGSHPWYLSELQSACQVSYH